MGSIPIWRSEIFDIFISLLWCRGKAQRRVSPLNASRIRQKMGNRVSQLGSLLRCVRDTVWSLAFEKYECWFLFLINIKMHSIIASQYLKESNNMRIKSIVFVRAVPTLEVKVRFRLSFYFLLTQKTKKYDTPVFLLRNTNILN